jgi:hypothetical protein
MKYKIVVALVFFLPLIGFTQQPDTLIKKLDSLNKKSDSAGGQVNNINEKAYNAVTKINVPTYFILLGSDLKQQVTAPFHASRRDWKNAGIFAFSIGALALMDEPIQRKALDMRTKSQTIQEVSRHVTNFGGAYEGYTLAALGVYGVVFKNEKMKTTTLLATQAYITGAVSFTVLKYLTGRQRPNTYDPTVKEVEPTFHGPFYKTGYDVNGNRISSSSFPSGHTTVAFAAATVYAMEYSNHPYIPVLAYSAATLIGISRITENRHWATDVLAGAALGFITGRQVVNNYHRYAKLRSPTQKKNTVTFTMQYYNKTVMPGVVYKFR